MSAIPRPPKPPPGTTSATASTPPEKQLSRLELFRQGGVQPVLPPNPAPHITDALMAIGPIEFSGGDRAPLSWSEINEWCAEVGPGLPAWQRGLIHRLSAAYLAESRAAEETDAPAPADGLPVDRDGIGKAVRSALADWKKFRA